MGCMHLKVGLQSHACELIAMADLILCVIGILPNCRAVIGYSSNHSSRET